MLKTKKERSNYISQAAREMAASGKYDDFMHIEMKLRADGFHEARSILDDRFIRAELNRRCADSKAELEGKVGAAVGECPHCDKLVGLPPEPEKLVGKSAACPYCGEEIKIAVDLDGDLVFMMMKKVENN